jgi:hypothetical protein
LTRLAFALSLALSATVWAQISPEREVELCRQSYDLGKFGDALQRAQNAIGLSNFSGEQRRTLLTIAGLSAFNLGDQRTAKAYFLQLLQLDPDFQLDPFAVAPPAIKLFELMRRDNAEALNLVRQQLALKLEQRRLEKEETERKKREEEERRRRIDELARTVTIRTIEKRPLWANFLPFGVGQFQQGRIGKGTAFAISEAILAVTSIVSYFAIQSLIKDFTVTFADRRGTYVWRGSGIPQDRMAEASGWTTLKFASGITFYALWVLGAGDALLYHRPDVATETKEPIQVAPGARLELSPLPGGLGAGFTVAF